MKKLKKEPFPLPCLVARGARDKDFDGLYRPAEGKTEEATLTFVPYAYFANRTTCDMQVWVRRK